MRTLPIDASRSLWVIAVLLVIAALYLASSVLIPAALALLLTFLLNPMVQRLERIGANRVVAVVVTVTVATLITAGVAFLVGQQALDLTGRLPDYRDNLRNKVRAIRPSGEGPVARVSNTLQELKQELNPQVPTTASAIGVPEPVKVEIVDRGPEVDELVAMLAGPLIVPLAQAGTVILLLIFLLLHSNDVRERLVWMAGMRQISLTTSAMNEIGLRIESFLRMQLVINLSYGAMVAIGLFAFGVPNALLWGVLAAALRFVPYVGPWLAAILPTLLTAAVFPGWTRALGVVGLFICVELISNMLMEPWLYGTSTGISSLGVVVAAVFWAWLWGPVGLVLAVPMTVCMIVIGKHVPQLALVNNLFGSEAAVPLTGRLYQNLLTGDATAADRLVSGELEDKPFAEVCDQTLVPVLAALKKDQRAGLIGVAQTRRAIRTLELVIPNEETAKPTASSPCVICIAAQDDVDTCAARLLARACQAAGVAAEALSDHSLANESADYLRKTRASHAAIVQVEPWSAPHSRRLVRVLSNAVGDAVELIDLEAGPGEPPAPRKGAKQSRLVHERSFARVVARLVEACSVTSAPRPVPAHN